jgi:CDP-diacylglycerol--glycerol-3-phosphate 3-phosphatidyltransferase
LATIYDFKPRFQALLRPAAAWLVRAGVSANAVTIAALLLSLAHGAWLTIMPGASWPLLLLPVTTASWPRSMGRRRRPVPC